MTRVPTPPCMPGSPGPARWAGEAPLWASAVLRASFSCRALSRGVGVVSGGRLTCCIGLLFGIGLIGLMEETGSIAMAVRLC